MANMIPKRRPPRPRPNVNPRRNTLLNRELITVQEESVKLLSSQLKDQQNRFEAGTVPRFNVLQAEVALANQQPVLIGARGSYYLALVQLAEARADVSAQHREREVVALAMKLHAPAE